MVFQGNANVILGFLFAVNTVVAGKINPRGKKKKVGGKAHIWGGGGRGNLARKQIPLNLPPRRDSHGKEGVKKGPLSPKRRKERKCEMACFLKIRSFSTQKKIRQKEES